MRKILELAALRSKRVELAGEVFVCKEPPFSNSEDFLENLKKDKVKAYQTMLLRYVFLEDGVTPAFTEEEALALATGSAIAFMPLFTAITGYGDREKKDSPPTNGSATDSPSPSDAPSKN